MKKLWLATILPLVAAGLLLNGCAGNGVKPGAKTATPGAAESSTANTDSLSSAEGSQSTASGAASESIVLGGGCFWCIEAVMETVEGVTKADSGYAGGTTVDPGYGEVCGGDTGHAEVVSVEYDPDRVSLEKLLDVFFAAHDPTSLDRQGNDTGSQYRSIILYDSEDQEAIIEEFVARARAAYDEPVVTEVERLEKFYPAEEYHQDYYERNPEAPYCESVISPKVDKAKEVPGL